MPGHLTHSRSPSSWIATGSRYTRHLVHASLTWSRQPSHSRYPGWAVLTPVTPNLGGAYLEWLRYTEHFFLRSRFPSFFHFWPVNFRFRFVFAAYTICIYSTTISLQTAVFVGTIMKSGMVGVGLPILGFEPDAAGVPCRFGCL